MGSATNDDSIGRIAIVGMSGRFPGARNLAEFWRNLCEGVESVSTFSEEELASSGVAPEARRQPGYVPAAAVLDDIEMFDAGFFGFSPREAQILDPQQRMFLECAWEALEDAGTTPAGFDGQIAVYAGQNISNYLLMNLFPRRGAGVFVEDFQTLMGNAKDYLATRIAYKLNLTGPAIGVQTACSTSLVAVCMACQSLLAYQCDMALAGGVTVRVPQKTGYLYEPGGILSPDGHCRAFDSKAQGTFLGSGLGIVVLKRLEDAIENHDRIHAVIRGSAVNNDGAHKIGYTAPGVEGQSNVVAMAQAVAGVKPENIGYIEAHGTGTPLGDPIEINALTRVFRASTAAQGFCAIGSVKTNFGHLEAAAGIAGLIKTVLAMKHRMLPPSLHFENPNPEIDFAASPFYVNARLSEWKSRGGPRLAGVSSFGIGGTNAHVVLEEAPVGAAAKPAVDRPVHVLAFSAKSPQALNELAASYAGGLNGNFADVCFSANTGRSHFGYRAAIVADSAEEARGKLTAFAQRAAAKPAGPAPKLAFLFTGQGGQAAQPGRELYETQPAFRREMQRCDRILRKQPEPGSQQALFAFQYALASLWQSWGVRPAAVLGHSLGEYAAACVAGVLSLEDALKLVTLRAESMQRLPKDGAMASVFASEERVRQAIEPISAHVSVAAINGPENCVISGRKDRVEEIMARLDTEGVRASLYAAAHAFHSPLMDPILPAFERGAAEFQYAPPQIDLVSTLTGAVVAPGEIDGGYWRRHVREPVRFLAGMQTLREMGCDAFLEIGPAGMLLSLGKRCLPAGDLLWRPSFRTGSGDWRGMLESLGNLYCRGLDVDWQGFDRDYNRSRISIPTYPFQRSRHWVERPEPESKPSQPFGGETQRLPGRRLNSPLRETQFELHANTELLPLLQEHRIHDLAVFPGAGYIEMAHAAAVEVFAGAGPVCVLEDVSIHEALMVPEQPDVQVVQTIVAPESEGAASFRILSLDRGKWKAHASGRISLAQDPAEAFVDREPLLARCSEAYEPDRFYRGLAERGLQLGPRFQWLAEIHRRDGEAIGRIRGAEPSDEAGAYLVHPGLMDASFQLLGAALPADMLDSIFAPVEMKRVRFHGGVQGELWTHVVLLPGHDPAQGTIVADIRLFDNTGRVLVDTEGLVARRTASIPVREAASVADWMYRVDWKRADRCDSAEFLPGADAMAAMLTPRLPKLRDEYGLTRYRDLAPAMDAVAVSYAVEAFYSMGWPLDPGTPLIPTLPPGRPDQRQRLLDRMLGMLAEAGIMRMAADGSWQVLKTPARNDPRLQWLHLIADYPEFEAELTLLESCGSQMAKVLRGECGALDVLFPRGSSATLEKLYRESPVSRVYNTLVRQAVARAVEAAPEGRSLRVLEIGGGTGGTTWYLLPELGNNRADYVFTDVSPQFTTEAAEKFREYPFVRYQVLDIERDPVAQGFAAQGFDLVVASNVLHATADLRQTLGHVRQLLAPEGMLVLFEGTGPQGWLDLIFGLTEGWWKFTDRDLRPAHPMMAQEKWVALLREGGFSQAFAVPGAYECVGGLSQPAVILARTDASRPLGKWLIHGDSCGAGKALAKAVEHAGGSARFEADSALSFDHVVYFAGAGHSDGDLRDVLSLVQAILRASSQPRLTLVTTGARALGSEPVQPWQALLWGLARVIAQEHPALQCICVDLDPAASNGAVEDLLGEICGAREENQVAFRGGARFVARLSRCGSETVQLQTLARGVLDRLALQPVTPREPGPGEIQVRVRATGLNFRDVLNALGAYPGDAGPLGNECAGVVAAVGQGVAGFQIGDEVVALGGGSFATLVTTSAALTVPKPALLSFEEAASLPIVFLTVRHALLDLAKIRPGENVLIHAAAGGVGLAAIQIAQRSGAVIFATAGSPEKQAYLRGLGVQHVMNSRSLDFADEVMAITHGEGVDVVLNSLSGEFIPRSLALLRPNGRFLEIGKNEIWSEGEVLRFRSDVSYFVIALDRMIADTSGAVQSMLAGLMKEFGEGNLKPLPLRVFELKEAQEAFRYMAQAKQIGKIVLRGIEERAGAPVRFRADASYWIAGGRGGLGLVMAEWMVERGARHLVLIGRSEASSESLETVRRMQKAGAEIVTSRGDIASEEYVADLLRETAASMPPLRGVMNCAGVLDDGILLRQDWSRFETVLAPKVAGSWNLHRATEGLPLDFFVLFSSTASLLGPPGQGNHAAANAFQDALAHYRRAQGMPGLSINWAAWSGIGSAAKHIADRQAFAGIDAIEPRMGLQAFELAMQYGQSQVAVMPVHWAEVSRQFPNGVAPPFLSEVMSHSRPATAIPAEQSSGMLKDIESAALPERRPLLIAAIRGNVAKVLGIDPALLEVRRPLNELGLDSLMAIELRNSFGIAAGRTLPATLLFDYPTVEGLADYFAREFFPAGFFPASAADDDSAGLDFVSDSEMAAMLSERLDAIDMDRLQ